MTARRKTRAVLGVVLVVALVAGVFAAVHATTKLGRIHIVAYFDNSNGLFKGDEVRILGVPVGQIDTIEPQPDRAKISFWVDDKYKIPTDVKAAILSPQLITSRAIQLTPAYTSGPTMSDGAVIPMSRTAVPVEWDDLRQQLEKLTTALQPTQPGGVSTLGEFVNTAADNLRGQGANIHDTVIKMSQAFSALGDHSDDIFATVKNLSLVVSALQSSAGLMSQLNQNLAAVTALLADDPNAVGNAVHDLNSVVGEAKTFIAENREALGITTDKLSSTTKAVVDSLDDIKQTLHVAPNAFQNFINIYQPAQAANSGALALNNFANPVSWLCGAIQAASRLGAEQSAKLCVQYLAPIIKNRQYNWLPIGQNFLVGATARPNEVTYSEDWMRPDHVPPAVTAPQSPPPAPNNGSAAPVLTPEAPVAAEGANSAVSTNPADGLSGIMVPHGAGA